MPMTERERAAILLQCLQARTPAEIEAAWTALAGLPPDDRDAIAAAGQLRQMEFALQHNVVSTLADRAQDILFPPIPPPGSRPPRT